MSLETAAAAPKTEALSPKAAEGKEKAPRSMAEALRRMKAAQRKDGAPSFELRMRRLDALEAALKRRSDDVVRACAADYGQRSRHVTLVSEVVFCLEEIRYVRSRLAEWMETEVRDVPLTLMPARCEVMMQPVGVVGIIVPWNYPVQLAFAPLIGALAAGNRAMIKMPELTPATSELVQQIVADCFDPDVVTVFTGDVSTGSEFSGLAFDHLVFTGSPRVGKIVMRAAAENLVPVTLELGGKSPALVGEGFSLDQAAERILWAKTWNSGQTCIAPDYVLVPKDKLEAFVAACKKAFAVAYPKLEGNDDVTSVISSGHYARLKAYLDEAEAQGARVVKLAAEAHDEASRRLVPSLVVDPSDDLAVMQDEIFGPILPIKPYGTLDEAIGYINDHPRPLALYVFDHDGGRVERVLQETHSGGVTVNDCFLHVGVSDAPFGGVGNSGMGHYHGREGFDAFTKKKTVVYQARLNATSVLRPPFGKALELVEKLLVGR